MKAILKVLVLVLAIAAAAWMGTLIYWQVRISRTIRVLEESATPNMRSCSLDPSPGALAARDLDLAGIRALPALVRSMQPSKRPEYLTEASIQFRAKIAYAAYQGSFAVMEQSEPAEAWFIPAESSPAVREEKCRLVQEWWRSNGRRFPWIWNPWSRGFTVR